MMFSSFFSENNSQMDAFIYPFGQITFIFINY